MISLVAYAGGIAVNGYLRDSGIEPRFLMLLVVELGSFLYSHLVYGGFARALNLALDRDWQAPRTLHYVLLGASTTLLVVVAIKSPGLLLGLLTQLVILWLGWRYTSERPSGTLKTLWLVLQQRKTT